MLRSVAIASATTALLFACVGDEHVDTSKTSSSSGGATGSSVVPNGDFETSGCAQWEATNSTVKDSPDARSGKLACLVCSNGDQPVYGLQQHISVLALKAHASYRATVHVRNPSTGVASDALRTSLFLDNGAGSPPLGDVSEVNIPGVTAPYAEASTGIVALDAHPEAKNLVIEVINRHADRGCFVIDDITLTQP